jgi:HipA-like protein
MIKSVLNKLFSKDGGVEMATSIPTIEQGKLTLKIDELIVGFLSCEGGSWSFKYSEEFKSQEDYHNLIGFPHLEEEYSSDSLWPFFKIRIPGLKQPAIKEIVEYEEIDSLNEFELLKRFGRKTISNPYKLEF